MKAPLFWDKNQHFLSYVLQPVAWLYRLGMNVRLRCYQHFSALTYRPQMPVVIVGNVNVGGSGKTPFVIWLVRVLQQAGFKPAVLTRGYGGSGSRRPICVDAGSDPRVVGDEPVLIAQKASCPVLVSAQRTCAARVLEDDYDCDVIICDDGLQHYALARDVEICVVDGLRRFGNGNLLPAGPLREPLRRLDGVDYIVTNTTGGGLPHQDEWYMRYEPQKLRTVLDDEQASTPQEPVCALAGIGYPPRFFTLLCDLGLRLSVTKSYPDHHRYSAQELYKTFGSKALIMTEKDAVKCRSFAAQNWYYLPIEAQLSDTFSQRLIQQITKVSCDSRP